MDNVIIATEQTASDLWWIGVIEATLALFFGISAIFWPGLTLFALVYLFSAFVLGLGLVEVVGGFMSRKARTSWWATVIIGAIGIGVGLYLVRHPNVSFRILILLIGLTLIAWGILDIMRAFVDRTEVLHKALWAVIGIAGIIAGILVLLQPAAGGVAFVWILGLYAIVLGVLSIVTSLELRTALTEAVEEEENDEEAVQPRLAPMRDRKRPA
jgi:uncharacterized membrane protein HdeD (DUF308 family)